MEREENSTGCEGEFWGSSSVSKGRNHFPTTPKMIKWDVKGFRRGVKVCFRTRDVFGSRDEPSGTSVKVSGRHDEMSVRGVNASGRHDEMSGTSVKIPGRNDESSGTSVKESGRHDELSGRGVKASGRHDGPPRTSVKISGRDPFNKLWQVAEEDGMGEGRIRSAGVQSKSSGLRMAIPGFCITWV